MTLRPGQVNLLTRSRFAKVCRTTPRTIRFYEKLGLLKCTYINPSNRYHYYDVKLLRQVTQIKLLQNFKISLKDINLFTTRDNFGIPFKQKLEELQHEIEIKQKEFDFLTSIKSYLFMEGFDKAIRDEYIGPYTLFCRHIENGEYHKINDYLTETREMAKKIGLEFTNRDITFYLDPIFKPKETKMEVCLICPKVSKGLGTLSENYTLKSFPKTRVLSFDYKGPYPYLTFIYQKFNEYVANNNIAIQNPVFEIYTVNPLDTSCEYDYITKVCYPHY